MLEQIILVIHVLIALAIIGLILLQQGKGADMGASFGGGGSQTLFGPSGGGNVLTRATAILATLFFVSSFGLAIIAKQKSVDVNAGNVLQALDSVAESIEEANAPEIGDIPVDVIEAQEPVSPDILDEIPQ
jgi:preprotein translocase subunit SecG